MRVRILGSLTLAVIMFFAYYSEAHATLAFPGAEGYGANTVGGRGGTIYKVTNLNDSGSGSLRDCAEATGARICIFDIGGTITLDSILQIENANLTIAGQTAPGDGITIKSADTFGGPAIYILSTSQIIIRHIRVRTGAPVTPSSSKDSIDINQSENVIIDHVSTSWSTDENLSALDSNNVTVQWSIMNEPLYDSTHVDGLHSMNSLLADFEFTFPNSGTSWHHNLFANSDQRNVSYSSDAGTLDFVNNVIYNWKNQATSITDQTGDSNANIVNNYYKEGPNTNAGFELQISQGFGNTPEVFASGNIGPNRPDENTANSAIVDPDEQSFLVPTAFSTPSVTTTSAAVAFEEVLNYAGAYPHNRDSVDLRVIGDVKGGLGDLVDDPSEVGGWPTLTTGTAPTDTDDDGMPDSWENSYGFDPNDASDGPLDADNDGYTNVEEYLNDTNPKTILSSWSQSNWFYGSGQTTWDDISEFDSSSNIDATTSGQLSLATIEKLTNGNFDGNLSSWDINIPAYTGDEPDGIANLALWLKADAITGLSDGDQVATWSDSSSAGNDATQGGAKKPTYETGELNDLPVVRFDTDDGSYDFMSLPEFMDSADVTMFVVGKSNNVSSTFFNDLSTSNSRFSSIVNSVGTIEAFIQDTTLDKIKFSLSNTDPSQYHIHELQLSGTTATLHFNGQNTSSTNASYDATTWEATSVPVIGTRITSGSEALDGDIAEIIIYKASLSDTDRQNIEAYLANKYNITLSSDASIAAKDTSTTYNDNLRAGSAKIITNSGFSANYVQSINVDDSNLYNLEAYAYTDGSAVTASDVEFYAGAQTATTTYASVGSGWYKLTATVNGVNAANNYGAQVKAGKTIYLDSARLYRYADSGSLTSSIFSPGYPPDWGLVNFTFTTPTGSSLTLKIRTFDTSSASDARAFSLCDPITSGTDISQNNCVIDGQRYAQYQVIMTPTSNPSSPTFASFALNFSALAPTPETCRNTAPMTAPLLYGAIAESNTTIRLYFTHALGQLDSHYVQYGLEPGKYIFGSGDIGGFSDGTYLVQHLAPNTNYYFRILPANGCAPGDWSNEVEGKTSSAATVSQTPVLIDKEKESFGGYTVGVRVIDQDGNPVKNADVTIFSDPKHAVTDENGYVVFDSVEAGEHNLLVSYDGYTGEQKIDIQGEVQRHEVTVKVQGPEPEVSYPPQELDYLKIGLGVAVVFLSIALAFSRRKS